MNTTHLSHRRFLRRYITKDVAFTILRVALGIMLIVKGIIFLNDSSSLQLTIQGILVPGNYNWLLADAIVWIHLVGGVFIVAGLATRGSCLVNIPIVLGAVLFVNLPHRTINGSSELLLSIVILALLIFFMIKGSGQISANQYFKRYYLAGLKKDDEL